MQQSQKPIIILDANAFISSNNLLNLGACNRLVTTSQVLKELRDQKTRNLLKSLPFQLETKQGSKESIQKVREFARKTGDIGSLSDEDVGIIALAHRYYLSQGLKECLRSSAEEIKEIINQQDSQVQSSEDEEDVQSNEKEHQSNDKEAMKGDVGQKTETADKKEQDNDGWITVPQKHKQLSQSEDSDMDSQEGWVTPQNYQEKIVQFETLYSLPKSSKKASEDVNQEHQKPFKVALMSADYAVQNVATQMGIRLLSLDGRKISSIRRFVWQCYLCWKQYKITENKVKLCINCGYNSLSKIAYSMTADRKMIMHRKKGWKPNQKVLQWKQKKFEQQQKRRKHQYPRKKKAASIFDTA